MPAVSSSRPPNDEAARLQSLRAYDVLPTLSEPVFDEYVALTARIFSLPISLISVVEEHDVHYPANHGLAGNTRQPRAEAVCSTAIARAQAVVYFDLALENSEFIPSEALAAARRNELRFYAGALLFLPDQRPLGTLCIIDRQPRTFTADEQHILELLAALVSQTIAVRDRCRTHSEAGAGHWKRLSAELLEEVQALNALVRYLSARHGTIIPVPTTFLAQVESRIQDLQELLSDYRP